MDEREIKLRCIEAAARNPTPHSGGFAAGVLETAKTWAAWVMEQPAAPKTLGLPRK